MKLTLPQLLSLNAGYVDTAGYIALHGLFTAHVTGNFVTFGAAMVHGTSGALAKLLALPMFCAVVFLTRLLDYALPRIPLPVLRTKLILKFLLLTAGAVLAIRLGPFKNGDDWSGLLTGMVLVSAMAVQNAVHRNHLASAPPSTLMTGTTTQIMIDLADLLHGLPGEGQASALARLAKMSASVIAFAIGCALAAVFFIFGGMRCFIIPPLLALGALIMRHPDEKQRQA
jgi:uncharacterized membrane protein YoaK (UPF0700 family)